MTSADVRTVNPATGEELAAYAPFDADRIEKAVTAAYDAHLSWWDAPFARRAELFLAVADVLVRRRAELARLMTDEMGKPVAEAEAELDKCVLNCRFWAEHAEAYLADHVVPTEAAASYVAYQPVGVVLAIMPWNFPFWQVVRFSAPALMAGNAALLKHAPNVTGCALAIEEVFREAGCPEGLFQTLVVAEPDVPATMTGLIEHPLIGAVTLTGSERAGMAVGSAAGRALKKSVLELGGSDPFVVLADADVALAARMGAMARFFNAGQACDAPKRFVVEEPVAEEFERLLVEAVRQLRVGDPTDPATDVGPMARSDLVDAVERQVTVSVEQGARVLVAGGRLPGDGCFFAPTVLTGVTADMAVYTEETFGPVAAIVRAENEADAVRIANDTPFGLSATVWTRDVERGQRVGRRIRSGVLFVNSVVESDPRLPFGGTRRSGYGRELAAEGIREFTNIRTFSVQAVPTAEALLAE